MPDEPLKTTDATAGPAAAAAAPTGDAPAMAIAPTVEASQTAAKPATLSVPSQADPSADGTPPAEGTLIGGLDADERIRASTQNTERTLWASAIVVTLLYSSLIASQVLLGDPILQAAQEQEQRLRRGQDAPSISVEIVPDPDKTSKTTRWREGEAQQTQTPTPSEQPPQPEQMASTAQPEVQEVEPKEETKEEKPAEDSPMLLDIDSLVDAAAQDLKNKIDRAFAKKPQKQQREQQAMASGGGMQVRGMGASGKSDAFSRSVIAALMKTRPGPFALWGRVLVSFELSPAGTLNYVHLLRSSGNAALDEAAVEAIHKARFKAPPPGLSAEQRTYIIDYIFG